MTMRPDGRVPENKYSPWLSEPTFNPANSTIVRNISTWDTNSASLIQLGLVPKDQEYVKTSLNDVHAQNHCVPKILLHDPRSIQKLYCPPRSHRPTGPMLDSINFFIIKRQHIFYAEGCDLWATVCDAVSLFEVKRHIYLGDFTKCPRVSSGGNKPIWFHHVPK